MKKKHIFIQIASYRDPQLLPTLRDCIEKAKYPENLVFSIAWQHSVDDTWDTLDEYKDDKRFRILDINYKDAKGVCWARHKLQQNYDGEEYTLQLDSHHRFSENWDEELITMYKGLQKKGYKKPLITGYIPSYEPDNDPQGRVNVPWVMDFDRFSPEGVVHFLPASIDNYKELTDPVHARFYSAHFAFTTGKFVKEVPHDPEYYFHGEEISVGVRAYTWGYDLFHPHKVIMWHEYTRKNKPRHWDDDSEWYHLNVKSFSRNRKLFGMDNEPQDIDFGIYGLGTVRTLGDYEKYSGLSFKKRSVQQYTLDKKLPPNPIIPDDEYEKSFVRVFKHCIDVGYDLVPEKDYDFWVVAFHGEGEGDTTLYRKDADKSEINRMMHDPDKYCKIWREFQTSHQPKYWVVWPHSVSKGWCERLTGNL
jgi:glycosyltransferase involved in cell wall biosynthesis